MKSWLYILFLILFVILVSIIPNIPLPFSFPLRINNMYISILNRITNWLPFIFLFGVIFVGFIIVFFKKKRNIGLKLLLFLFAVIFICFISSKYVSPVLRDYSKGYVIGKVQPLINALEKYKLKNNSYPESLNFLVPLYIDKIPTTRVLTIKNIEYRRGEDDFTLLFIQYINGWDIDIVLYNSNSQYDEELDLRKFGNWRYYHKK